MLSEKQGNILVELLNKFAYRRSSDIGQNSIVSAPKINQEAYFANQNHAASVEAATETTELERPSVQVSVIACDYGLYSVLRFCDFLKKFCCVFGFLFRFFLFFYVLKHNSFAFKHTHTMLAKHACFTQHYKLCSTPNSAPNLSHPCSWPKHILFDVCRERWLTQCTRRRQKFELTNTCECTAYCHLSYQLSIGQAHLSC
jgi:hypothetical protein